MRGLLTALGGVSLLYVLSRTDKGATVVARATDAALSRLPRGIRNNNPGNIRHNKANAWMGQSDLQTDPDFVQFTNPQYGVRALGRILTTYSNAPARLNTVRDLIGRWAPSTENNTANYIKAVSRELAVDPQQVIDVREYLPRLASAIIRHENGQQPYSPTDLQQWVYS